MLQRNLYQKFAEAVKKADFSSVQSLLQSNGFNINCVGNDNKTALHHAILTRDAQMVRFLLAAGADVEQSSDVTYHRHHQLVESSERPLITAARLGGHDVARKLLLARANPDAQQELKGSSNSWPTYDKTSLHWAVEDLDIDLVKLLLDFNADVNVHDRSGELPIHKAVRCKECAKQTEILLLLCKAGSQVNYQNKIQCAPLYIATFYRCIRKVETLIKFGADVNSCCFREHSYGTPLHIAAYRDDQDTAKLLISHGAKLNERNALECTPLQLNITAQVTSEIAQLLIFHGASLEGVDKWKCPLLAACIRNMRLDCEILARLMLYAGYDLRKENWLKPQHLRFGDTASETPEVPIPHGRVERLCEWLRAHLYSPLKLTDLCRITVRKCLCDGADGRSIVSGVQTLPLPNAIKEFLLLKNIFDSSAIYTGREHKI